MPVEEVAENLWFAHHRNTNWVLYGDDTGVTLIDGGYPGERDLVEQSIRAIGRRPQDVRGILITHAHLDHLGGLPWLAERHGVPVYTSEREAAHARREFLEQISLKQVLSHLHHRPWRTWLRQVAPLFVGKMDTSLPTAQAFPHDGPLDLPGSPVPVAAEGHTSGHVGYHFPALGALVTGDALVTAHGTSRLQGPQLLHTDFQEDLAQAARSLDGFVRTGAVLILPGHGPALRMPIAEAVAAARAA
ncbi:MBL fold metallo-hydrolase [Kineosporia sp. J2-2]|uniref:MBL fold metallo-hydrolase n=1 Tax=Kineosporia corallincola TaxID=2835133 RepID=A0ABS5TIL4_9ACTN|nr:MBL fold metallo-hydrolase [Kineosporia corallincola]MBT0769419.1 MBL fold metallo-hydrolase [Kineosporia corallincola]